LGVTTTFLKRNMKTMNMTIKMMLGLVLVAGPWVPGQLLAQNRDVLESGKGAFQSGGLSAALELPEGMDVDKLKDAVTLAAREAWVAYVNDLPRGRAVQTYAVLPVQRDVEGGYVAQQVRNLFTQICGEEGFKLYSRMDAEWGSLLKEIAWGETLADTMDPATVQKFGRIQGVQALVFPRITGVTVTETKGAKVRLNLQVFEVETGEQLWGREVVMTQDGAFVPLGLNAAVGNYKQWILVIGGGLLGLLVLVMILRWIGQASTPR